ncbi:hydroxymethylpyrimidine/phosphomethylpyrimidine kinase [Sphingobacterium sp. SRCM116780]|uniref:hydroxymethylpyrimidine/phosphomethylpyrimidine kinase n=1 Tax=Sphingobacterium sp. SRCM116780 TaxID=2907623 RepID=UPI001F180AC5|nr:hydroxymethylpyrimidine/phosphomethylpyrimidine kinase [Sphingobacterium sp. SRCM116780]UIR56899.1 hydroxymethylpyrimidine/phosphomethylpyrimidine kinase [Sphingobacterium sp. SRCM116780]
MSTARPFVLSIAGFDPSGGAGVLADMKTMEQLNIQGMSVLTANTLQSADKLFNVEWFPIQDVLHAIETLLLTYPIQVIKIGIVPNPSFLVKILKTIQHHRKDAFIIWDPVIRSSSGFQFFKLDHYEGFPAGLNQLQLITPNQLEYDFFQENGLLDTIDTQQVAILRKGGHREEMKGTDILYHQQEEIVLPPTIPQAGDKHGSGCVLSSAIAAYIARGYTLIEACRLGKIYIEQFLNSNQSLLGHHHVQ